MNGQTVATALHHMYGITVTPDEAEAAYKELGTYHELHFETLRGKYKLAGDCYVLLAVENTQMHNGAWVRYIDSLKATYPTIVVQSVVNKRLYGWFLRNGFKRTAKNKHNVIWRAPHATKPSN